MQKRFTAGTDAIHAVDGVSIDLIAGETVAIMGASGSGKTTLLHLLGGLLRPDSGILRFAGADLATLSDAALTSLRCERMGIVYQSSNLIPTLSALDNVALPMLLNGSSRTTARAAAHERLREVGLGARALHRPGQMSGGEQQRVAIARALIAKPELVLADEPTGSLDRQNSLDVCQLLHQVAADRSRSVVIVTHDPAVALLADRILVLSDGKLVSEISRADVATAEEVAIYCMRVARRNQVFAPSSPGI
ncbi:ABC transporter ATP-binding protein [Caulifigura coniformis]|uniref:ABC transporter ATP-binding protein n=1 Tax=Caulifigura coniformis TaxID=2527983 RepID=UPI001E483682|nr:ABC transporter ATP-binding protein [Caulifigura coniformis]